MRKVLFVLVLMCMHNLSAQTIGIDVEAINRIVNIPPPVKNVESVVEVIPVTKIPSYNDVSVKRTDENSFSGRAAKHGANEDARDEFIKSLRFALEKGRDFKYYYPNFDYGQCKKELEQMMRDTVSQ